MKRKAFQWTLPAIAAVAVFAALPSCTPEEKHRALTFFFDGVPPLHPPEDGATTQPTGTGGDTRPRRIVPVVYRHKPAADTKQCRTCHDVATSFGLVKPLEDLCVSCHQKETRAYPRMHGPVAAGECGACHEAHESRNKHLVLEPVPKLCFRCHGSAPDRGPPAACARESDTAACGTCHQPHGGSDRFFLVKGHGDAGSRPDAGGRTPTSRPVEKPAGATGPESEAL